MGHDDAKTLIEHFTFERERKIQTFSLIMIQTRTIGCFVIFGLILSQEDHMPFLAMPWYSIQLTTLTNTR